jgi:hypothetical protein
MPVVFIILGLSAIVALYFAEQATAQTGGASTMNLVPSTTVTSQNCQPITSDMATWPGDSSDPVWLVCYAIAQAEGANVAGSAPDRLNNPGDLSDGYSQYGGQFTDGSSVTNFPDKQTGWQWLYSKVYNIKTRKSTAYNPDETWNQIAQSWAGNWQNWVNNVTSILGVKPTDRMGDFLGV